MTRLAPLLVCFLLPVLMLCAELPNDPHSRLYEGWKVVRVTMKKCDLQPFVSNLEDREDVSLWGIKRASGASKKYEVDVMIAPGVDEDQLFRPVPQDPFFEDPGSEDPGLEGEVKFRTGGRPFRREVLIPDVGIAVTRSKNETTVRSNNGNMDWQIYHSYKDIEDFVTKTILHRRGVSTVEVRKSVEERGIYAVVIGANQKMVAKKISEYTLGKVFPGAPEPSSRPWELASEGAAEIPETKQTSLAPVILIEAAAHAREWISPATATYMIDKLTSESKEYLRKATWVILPMVNPDGYEFSRITERLWRKNRQINSRSRCKGVDLNRNYGRNFGGLGTSSNACSDIYTGKWAFSEPETMAVRDVFDAIGSNNVKFFLSLHCYGSALLYPWGDDYKKSPWEKELYKMGRSIANAIEKFGHHTYEVMQSGTSGYLGSGASDDYMHDRGVKLAFTLELPGETSGFLLPADRILAVATETYCALKCVPDELNSNSAEAKKCWNACG